MHDFMEKNLTVSEKILKKLAFVAQDAIVMMDSDGLISFWNRAAEHIFGYASEEALNKPLHRLIVPPIYYDDFVKGFDKFQSTGVGNVVDKTHELVAIRRDGTELQVELSISAIEIEGFWHSIGIIRDITSRKLLEQELYAHRQDLEAMVQERTFKLKLANADIEQVNEFLRQEISERKQLETKLHHNYYMQEVISTMLQIALEQIPLKNKLESALDLVLSAPWIKVQKKACIFLTHADSNTLTMVAQRHLPQFLQVICRDIPFGKCLCGLAASTRKVMYANHVNELHEVSFDGMTDHGHYCIPIKSGSVILGVLNLYVDAGHKRDKLEEDFLIAMSNTLAGIIEHGKVEDAIKQSNAFIHTVLNSMNDAVIVINVSDFGVVEVNQVFLKEYGFLESEVKGNTCHVLIHKNLVPCHQRDIQCPIMITAQTGKHAKTEHIHHNRDGKEIYIGCSSSPILDENGQVSQCVYVLRNISERKNFESQLQRLAHFDTLTSLPNRMLFHDRFNGAIELARRDKYMFALLFIDLDNFKIINDTLGHDYGDILLQEASIRLLENLRKSDTAARMGGDEFTIILSKINEPEDAALVAEKIIASMNRPYYLKDKVCNISASIGISVYPFKNNTEYRINSELLLKQADIAMYRAKKQGRNGFQFYTDIIARVEDLVDIIVGFIMEHEAKWDHQAWVELLLKIQEKGFELSDNSNNKIGNILETTRTLYRLLQQKNDILTISEFIKKIVNIDETREQSAEKDMWFKEMEVSLSDDTVTCIDDLLRLLERLKINM
ncbi:protein containing Diguanylate cyclase, predicted [Candidatus Magnetobacterium bavaricum]|uniref:Protein containing Diguanylate cyclase, predicted n=1 Tax=Candidatus Magnetobacterium bavaricum TaxID=29290 RepID=A0A0F3GMM5_9BACT|nr:protein containing Diguanylate cyclase, predicted [Candidatus Magnetobacterium bavaricum]